MVPAGNVAPLIALSAQGAATVTSEDQFTPHHRGVQVLVDITAITGTGPTATVKIQGKDLASGQYYDLLTSAALSAVASTLLTVYPGGLTTANVATPQPLPAVWRVSVTVAGTGPAVTATIGASPIV